jgi:hypothetical protein
MVALKKLLLDVRVILRTGVDPPNKAELIAKLDEAISWASRQSRETAEAPEPRAAGAQAAVAWQMAARNLKRTHPEAFFKLQEEVSLILEQRGIEDPDKRLKQLERELKEREGELEAERSRRAEREQRIAELESALAGSQAEEARILAEKHFWEERVNELYRALATLAPELTGEDPQRLALLRIDHVREQLEQARRSGSLADGGNAPSAAPSRAVIEQVAAGQAHFSDAQRDWVIGEALTLTNWELSPIELLAKGDAWLARLLLERRV